MHLYFDSIAQERKERMYEKEEFIRNRLDRNDKGYFDEVLGSSLSLIVQYKYCLCEGSIVLYGSFHLKFPYHIE